MKTAASLALALLGACAAPKAGKHSYTPRTEVVVKGGKKKPAQANYRVSPDKSMRTGSGGSAK